MAKIKGLSRVLVVGLAVWLLSGTFSHAQEPTKRERVELTVYNNNLGLVKEERLINLPKGRSELRITDVARQIDTTSVHFKSLTEPEGCYILEQNFEYDLISRNKLLEKYLDREIILEKTEGESEETYDKWATLGKGSRTRKETTPKVKRINATLLSTKGGMVVRIGDEIHLNPTGRIILPALPEGLITKPTLMWQIDNKKEGRQKIELSYLTKGIDWRADYTAITKKDGRILNLASWVTINNHSGTTYPNAKLKLMAGDVHRVEEERGRIHVGASLMLKPKSIRKPAFEEKPFFEYHLYTLSRPSTIKDNQIKQIEFIHPRDIATEKLYFYDGIGPSVIGRYDCRDSRFTVKCNKKVNVMLEFTNSKENNLGIPLPKGKIRVYKQDPEDKGLEFIGEDTIDHTPKDEKVRLYLGDAFDIVGEHIQTNLKKIANRVWEESFKIKLRNHKDKNVEIKVIEHLYRWKNWEITQKSQDYEKLDARTIQFLTKVPKNGEKTITYTVRYTW